ATPGAAGGRAGATAGVGDGAVPPGPYRAAPLPRDAFRGAVPGAPAPCGRRPTRESPRRAALRAWRAGADASAPEIAHALGHRYAWRRYESGLVRARRPAVRRRDARPGVDHLRNAVLEADLARAAHDEQVARRRRQIDRPSTPARPDQEGPPGAQRQDGDPGVLQPAELAIAV